MAAIKPNLLLFLTVLYVLDPLTYGFIFGYLLCVILLIQINVAKFLFDNIALSLLLFSLTYAAFYAFNPGLGAQFILIYAIIPTSMYMVGKILRTNLRNESLVFWSLVGIGFTFSLPSIISIFLDIYLNGFVKVKRDVINIWTGELLSATNMAAGFALNMCIPSFILLGGKVIKKRGLFILLLAIYVLSLICVFRLGSRTQLALSIFTLVSALLYKIKKQNLKKNLGLFFIIFIVINVIISYVSIDTDSELLSAYADRADSKTHGTATAGGRTNKWEKSIVYMFKEPLGWDLTEFGFSHNLWFDTTRVGGLICLSLLMIFTVLGIKKIFGLLNLHSETRLLDGQLMVYCICFFLSFFVEPILEGYFILFSLFCLVLGIISAHIACTKNTMIET